MKKKKRICKNKRHEMAIQPWGMHCWLCDHEVIWDDTPEGRKRLSEKQQNKNR